MARTRARVETLSVGESPNARDTVACGTPVWRATSSLVANCTLPCGHSSGALLRIRLGLEPGKAYALNGRQRSILTPHLSTLISKQAGLSRGTHTLPVHLAVPLPQT